MPSTPARLRSLLLKCSYGRVKSQKSPAKSGRWTGGRLKPPVSHPHPNRPHLPSSSFSSSSSSISWFPTRTKTHQPAPILANPDNQTTPIPYHHDRSRPIQTEIANRAGSAGILPASSFGRHLCHLSDAHRGGEETLIFLFLFVFLLLDPATLRLIFENPHRGERAFSPVLITCSPTIRPDSTRFDSIFSLTVSHSHGLTSAFGTDLSRRSAAQADIRNLSRRLVPP